MAGGLAWPAPSSTGSQSRDGVTSLGGAVLAEHGGFDLPMQRPRPRRGSEFRLVVAFGASMRTHLMSRFRSALLEFRLFADEVLMKILAALGPGAVICVPSPSNWAQIRPSLTTKPDGAPLASSLFGFERNGSRHG